MKKGLKKFNELVEALESLPTIGKKSAMRLAYHLVMENNMTAMKIVHAIENAVSSIQKCSKCGGISEDEICYICADEHRDSSLLCIVESAKDINIIEESGEYFGRYFVLDSIEEDDIERLKDIVSEGVEEIIFALTPSIANETVILYVEDKLKDFDLVFTKIAQGVPTGVSLENVDMLSISKALHDRIRI
ncbi:recombination mediator RecR [Nitrosophilus alvini]|uniref:recombination mediator RecR n=1 Tax=Nitrosophilus alvini TaxID=2714855 RepID=UPI00190BCEFE|nr:recombination mediator RecR [Nitrosophilus alvini]